MSLRYELFEVLFAEGGGGRVVGVAVQKGSGCC